MKNEKSLPQSSSMSQETIISLSRRQKAKNLFGRALRRRSIFFKKPSKREELSLHLPGLIEEEILSRLPVKSLLRFRCVSKPWRSLIDCKSFTKLRLQNYTNNRKTILQCCEHGFRQHGPDQSSYCNEPSLPPSPINDPQNNHLIYGQVVGCSNGLICVLNRPSTFFLWNPTIKSSLQLPKLDAQNLPIKRWGFGWDEESDAYKVFVGMSDESNKGIGQVYSSKTNSWRRLEYESHSVTRLEAMLVCGNFHWFVKNGGGHVYIETFDLKSEVFGTMELPFKPEKGVGMWLSDNKVSLRVLCDITNDNTKCRAWVMEEYGVKESWVEKMIRLNRNGSCCRTIFYSESLVSPLLFNKN